MIRLKHKTKKGKQIIKRCGDKWDIIKQGKVCGHIELMALIKPVVDTPSNNDNIRWVSLSDDKDFIITDLGDR